MTPSPTLILYPLFAMFYLVAFVLLRLRRMRFAAVRSGEVKTSHYRAYRRPALRAQLRAPHLE